MIPSRKLIKESTNYEYLNSVVRARGDKLLPREVFRRLTEGTLEDLELFLLESSYGPRYREQLARGEAALLGRVETAMAMGAADILLDLASLARGEALLFLSLILSTGDLHNGRILLRASPGGMSPKKSPVWHRYSLADVSFYDDLWKKCKSPADVAIRSHEEDHPIARILGDSHRILHEKEDLFSAERYFYSTWLNEWRKEIGEKKGQNGRVMREYLGRMTDLWNFSIWLRPKAEAFEGDRFLPGGWGFSREDLEGTDDDDLLLSRSMWIFDKEKDRGRQRAELFRSLQRQFYDWQQGLYRRNLLGIDVSLSYAARVVQEWKNLSMIAVGLSLKMPPGEMERHLFLPYPSGGRTLA